MNRYKERKIDLISLVFLLTAFIYAPNGGFAQNSKSITIAGKTRELHVSKKGHDTGTGSINSPFLTISRAANSAEPGDKIIIHAGTYREQVMLPLGGNDESSRISFLATPGEAVIVKGSELIKNWKPEGGGIWRAEVDNKIFENFNPFITVVSGSAGSHLGEVYVNGLPYGEQQTQQDVAKRMGGWFASGNENSTSIWANFGKLNPNQNLVEINVRAAAFKPEKPGVNFITIDGIKVAQVACDKTTLNGDQPAAISTRGGIYWIIQNCEISDAKCVGISLEQPGGHDTSRHNYNRPAFGEFENIDVVGHHIIRNNFIHRCGQAGIVGLLHGTLSQIEDNQIEDINGIEGFSADDVAGIRMAVAVDAIIGKNFIRRIKNGSGILMGPLYQGVRITGNVIANIEGSPLYFYRSHGLALIDKNVIDGSGSDRTVSIKLRSAEANVFAQNLFKNCSFINEPLPFLESFGTINYLPHSLVTKQTIPALALDNKWFSNIFIHRGLDAISENHSEADYNVYLNGAAKSLWGDSHSKVIANDVTIELLQKAARVDILFNPVNLPNINAPVIDTGIVGRFALSESIELPDGTPVKLNADFFGKSTGNRGVVGPFINQDIINKISQLFEYRKTKGVTK
ncbi:MAG: right-handed parallel beta-helix repeat-containing protein [Ferruginibacter sp.]